MKPFTVIIPTRERADTLAQALETCLWQQDEHLRIIVSDNASTDSTREVVQNCQKRDKRVEYINPGRRLSMSAHWEFALGHVTEGMVMVLGDDDGLVPDALPRARAALAESPGTLAINWDLSYYKWPATAFPDPNHLQLRLTPGKETWNAKTWLEKVAQSQAAYAMLPYVYYGFVDASVLNQLRARSSRLIHSSIPDVFLAIAVTGNISEYLHLDQPLAVAGLSRHSTGHAQVCPGGSKENAGKFQLEADIPFHPGLTFVPSIHVTTAECILQAQDAGVVSRDLRINWARVVTRTFCDLYSQPFSEEERAERLIPIRQLSEQVACSNVLTDLVNLERQGGSEWMGKIPMDLAWEGGKGDVSLDLSVYGATGIADACRIAGLATQTGEAAWKKFQAQSASVEEEATQLRQELASTRQTLQLEQQTRLRYFETKKVEIERLNVDLTKWRARAKALDQDKRKLKNKISALRKERKERGRKHLAGRIRQWWKRVRGKAQPL